MVVVELPPAGHIWLSTTSSAAVLYLFRQGCYLQNPAGAILALVCPVVGSGPFQAVLGSPFEFERLDPLAAVSLEPTRLLIGRFAFDFSGAKLGEPRPDWVKVSRPGLSAALPTLHTLLAQTRPPAAPLSPSLLSLPQTGRLLAALQANDRAGCTAAVAALAGLGQGLTPAGDDFLMGIIYGLWAARPESPLIAAIVQAAIPRTTRLSAAWLAAAGRGEASQPWHVFVQALITNAPLEPAARTILNIGHSSGREALTGFTTLLHLEI